MSKVRAPEQKGEGFPAVLQPDPMLWALIRALFLAQLQKLPLASLFLLTKASVLAPFSSRSQPRSGSQRVAFRYPHSWSVRGPFFLNTVPLTLSEVHFSEPFSIVVFGVGKVSCSRKAQWRLQPEPCTHSTPAGLRLSLPPSLLARSREPKLFTAKKLLAI